jgi:DNA-binding CsgD family transcriptional regulator
MMDSIDIAFAYYTKAGEIFDRYGWNESNAVLHYNMGETWLDQGDFSKARECYEAALRYGRQAGDSLWIATPLKGLGALYLEQGRTRKGLRCLEEADRYFSIHEDQEFRARLETLDFMGQILRGQRRQLRFIISILVLALLLLAAYLMAARKLHLSRKEGKETGEVLEEAIAEIGHAKDSPKLTGRELEIMKLFAQGMTGPQIAEKVFLSPETVKWYRKKLLVKFDAANTPELISKAKDAGLI